MSKSDLVDDLVDDLVELVNRHHSGLTGADVILSSLTAVLVCFARSHGVSLGAVQGATDEAWHSKVSLERPS